MRRPSKKVQRPPSEAPWSAEVTRELARLGIAAGPFDPTSAPRPLERFGRFGDPVRRAEWAGVDPQGQVIEAPPVVWAFMQSRACPPNRFARSDGDALGWAMFRFYGRYDLVVDGTRRLLVGFAANEALRFFYLDLCDHARDPAVWSIDSTDLDRKDFATARIAYAKLSLFLATLVNGGTARDDSVPPFAPAVHRELGRLGAVMMAFDLLAPRPLTASDGFWNKERGNWEDVDPLGEISQVPPAVFAFLKNVDFRAWKIRRVRADDEIELELQSCNENCDVTIDGARHLLVQFATDEGTSYCLDLFDHSDDPAVWALEHGCCWDAGILLPRLSAFLETLRI